MYRINRLSRPVLITVDEVITKAVVDEGADIRYLMNSIEVAEERFIAPALGDGFYEDFIMRKNQQVTALNQATLLAAINASLIAAGKNPITVDQLPLGIWVNAIELCPDNYQLLWNRFLWKICAEATDILAIAPSWLRSTAQGQQYNNPKVLTSEQAGSASGDRKDIEYKIDEMLQQRLYPLLRKMQKWIEERGGYTLYKDYNKKSDGVTNRVGGIIFDIYEDKNPNGPDMWQPGTNRQRNERRGGGREAVPVPAYVPAYFTRSITVFIKDDPDPSATVTVGQGRKIYAQYPVGNTLTITIKETPPAADYAYLVGKQVSDTVNISNQSDQLLPFNETTGTYTYPGDNSFLAGDYITIEFQDYV